MSETVTKLKLIPFPSVNSVPLLSNHVILRSPATIVTVQFNEYDSPAKTG